jgi:tetratricopeptide (TPR) repeat protein
MKLLKLFLLLSIGLWADIAPSGIKMEQLSPIIENGWNDHNKTLNKIIVDNGERKLPEILIKLDKPLSGVTSVMPVPKFLLTRDDYYFIFSYVKYLEAKGEIDQAIEVYTRALKGLSNIKNNSVIGYIYHLVMEKITVESINQMIKTKKVSATQSANMKEELQSTLFLDNNVLFDAILGEIEINNSFLTTDGLGNIKEKNERVMFKEIIRINIELSKKYYYKLWAIKSSEEKEFMDIFEKEKNIFFENNERENDLNIQIAGKTLFYTATLSPEHFFEMKKDIDEEIKRNRALLKSLER